MIGQTISHYEILEFLGQGGMGVVYKARDTKLKRTVALKFLSIPLATDPTAKSRLEQEAQAASSLEHPNIVTIYEIDDVDQHSFISMSYVNGPSLKSLIDSNSLTMTERLKLAVQIAEGLNAAHQKEIVHRDIKSSNILVSSDGTARITDFGLAKLREGVSITESGSTIGTAAYMSPEQAWGREADHRADIFSFGVVLYELLTGTMPFRGERLPAVIYSILNDTPPPMSDHNNDIPDGLQAILDKALQKNPNRRYQSMTDLLTDLKQVVAGELPTIAPPSRGWRRTISWPTIGVASVLVVLFFVMRYLPTNDSSSDQGPKRIAVLPFAVDGETETDLSDRLTHEITARLSSVEGLSVISRSSAMTYRNSDKRWPEIGRELGVAYVLGGELKQDLAGDDSMVSVTPELVRVNDDRQIWSNSYRVPMSKVFDVQSDIAIATIGALGVTLADESRRSIATRPTANLEAYEFYVRGSDYFERGTTRAELTSAVELFTRAVALDSTFAKAHALLSQAHTLTYWYNYDPSRERLTMARTSAERALALDPNLPEGHLALGYYYYRVERDYERALSEFESALKRQPNNADLYEALGFVQRRRGNFEGALANLQTAQRLDPLSEEKAYEVGNTLLRMRRWDEALQYFDRAIALAPDWPVGYYMKAWLHIYGRGDTKAARGALTEASGKLDPASLANDWALLDMFDRQYQSAIDRLTIIDADTIWYQIHKGQFIDLLGQPDTADVYYDSARVSIEQALRELPPSEVTFRKNLAIAYAGLGLSDSAVREAQSAVDMLPVSKDAFHGGPSALENLALVYLMLGQTEDAARVLDSLLRIPGLLTPAYLKLDPRFEPAVEHISVHSTVASGG